MTGSADIVERACLAAARRAPGVRGRASLGWMLMRRAERRDRAGGSLRLTMRDGSVFELPRETPDGRQRGPAALAALVW
jgi:hypothetical protein